MNEVIDHQCLHCNKWKGDHQSGTMNCPVPSTSRTFKHFVTDKAYKPNLERPKTAKFTI